MLTMPQMQKYPQLIWLAAILFFARLSLPISADEDKIPKELQEFLSKPHPLPKYAEANYSLLGRSPVVDALLGDPFYIPVFAEMVSQELDKASANSSLAEVAGVSFRAGGIPQVSAPPSSPATGEKTPLKFIETFGPPLGDFIYAAWREFSRISKACEEILSPLTACEKEWLCEHCESYFFGENNSLEYDFFTTDSPLPLNIFELASKIDVAALAASAKDLALIVDQMLGKTKALATLSLENDFIWEEEGRRLWISDRENAVFKEDADFFLHLKGNCKFENNAGGTRGKKPCALHICLRGNNLFAGDKFVQGAGILGVGILANFGGSNTYKAKSFSQAAAFLGIGIVMDMGGGSDYQIGYFGQSAALFGASLLWNQQGECLYFSRDGMSQGASSTLGCAFLADGAGGSVFVLGSCENGGDDRSMGIGQGGSVGVRYDPWKGNPSFYGGLSFLYTGGGKNRYKGGWYSQGSAYFLGAGLLVDKGKEAIFSAEVDSQGQGLHLSCGCLLRSGGSSRFDSGFGSQGVAGDRSAAWLIHEGGPASFIGGEQTIGSARKPKAIGVLLNFGEKSSFLFGKLSSASIEFPRSPLEWPKALFLSAGQGGRFSKHEDSYERCDNCQWGISPHSLGFNLSGGSAFTYAQLFSKLPQRPRIDFDFDPVFGWRENTAFRPLKVASTKQELDSQVANILISGYDERRRLYECLDLYRFLGKKEDIDLSPLLGDLANAPVDRFNYAALWALNDKKTETAPVVALALGQSEIASPYSEKMAIRLIGELGSEDEISVLEKVLDRKTTEENQALAVYFLAKAGSQRFIPALQRSEETGSEEMRFALAAGLKESPLPEALDLLIPLLGDPSFYVRRRAALSALSLRYKPAIQVLLDTLKYRTLDTTENYGDNLFRELADYVGVDFGIDRQAWKRWWEHSKESFQFPPEKSKCPPSRL